MTEAMYLVRKPGNYDGQLKRPGEVVSASVVRGAAVRLMATGHLIALDDPSLTSLRKAIASLEKRGALEPVADTPDDDSTTRQWPSAVVTDDEEGDDDVPPVDEPSSGTPRRGTTTEPPLVHPLTGQEPDDAARTSTKASVTHSGAAGRTKPR